MRDESLRVLQAITIIAMFISNLRETFSNLPKVNQFKPLVFHRIDISNRYVGYTIIWYTTAMIELAILGLLKERPMHGYDLRKRLRDDFGPLANISYGSL